MGIHIIAADDAKNGGGRQRRGNGGLAFSPQEGLASRRADWLAGSSPRRSSTAATLANLRLHQTFTNEWLACLSVPGGKELAMARFPHPLHRGGEPGNQKGALGYVLAWLLGVPIPILIIVALLRSCA